MDNWIKGLRVIVCIILLAALCACSAVGQSSGQPYSSELEDRDRQITSLEAQIVVLEEQLSEAQGGMDYEGEYGAASVDLGNLLDQIESSDEKLVSYPALVLSANVSEAGCTLTIDRLEYNPNFEIGGAGDEGYLLNAEAVTEEIDASFAYAQFNGRTEGEVSEAFADYIQTFGGGAQFTLYTLGGELVLVSEITLP